jgi:UDP-N-acetylmuramoyl-tripeptide--D-alanyl-D-alanine ligase
LEGEDVATQVPDNRASFSVPELALLLGAPVDLDRHGSARVSGVSTDSRRVGPEQLFVALRGDRFDGHEHARGASERGARAVLSERAVDLVDGCVELRVPSCIDALATLARAHRVRWARASSRAKIVGITGSAGKTTTRHAVAALLASLGRSVHSSAGNLNNAVGAPMSALGLESEHDVGVLEMGMNSPGEIAHLARALEPDVGVLTLVAHAHTEGVGSIAGVLREKSDLLAYLPADGVAIVNVDSPLTRAALVRASSRRVVTYGAAEDADVRVVSRVALPSLKSRVRVAWRHAGAEGEFEAEMDLLGAAGALAGLAAVAVALSLEGIDVIPRLPEALAAIPPNERGRLSPKLLADGTLLIDDAYNANPASMCSSIAAASELASSTGRRLILALGSMLELGAESEALHESVGEAARGTAPAALLVVGAAARGIARAAGSVARTFDDVDAAAPSFLEMVEPGDLVLVKASNSIGLGRLAELLKGRVT